MKLIFVLLFLPMAGICQPHAAKADTNKNNFGDSIAAQALSEKYSPAHQLMSSFTTGTTADLSNLWTYLLSELHYRTDKPNTISFKSVKNGLSTNFTKYGAGYEQSTQTITVNLVCNRDGSNLKSVSLTGSNDLLTEIFVNYFDGAVKQTGPAKIGLNIVNTLTNQVNLQADKITIMPLHGL